MAVKRKPADSSSSPVSWTMENELKLYKAALKYKPAGILKHFNMALIHHELTKSGMRDVTTQMIWDHLGELYDLPAANALETGVPALDETENEFSLPKKDFMEVLNEMKKSDTPTNKDTKETETKEEISKKTSVSTPSVPAGGNSETPKTGSKRPTRSTPGSGPASAAKRRK